MHVHPPVPQSCASPDLCGESCPHQAVSLLPAREGFQPSPNFFIPPAVAFGLEAPRAGKEDGQGSGSTWGGTGGSTLYKKATFDMLFFLIGDIHPYPLIPLGSAWLMKLSGRVFLGLPFASNETGRAEHPKVWMDLHCFSKQKQQGPAPGTKKQ